MEDGDQAESKGSPTASNNDESDPGSQNSRGSGSSSLGSHPSLMEDRGYGFNARNTMDYDIDDDIQSLGDFAREGSSVPINVMEEEEDEDGEMDNGGGHSGEADEDDEEEWDPDGVNLGDPYIPKMRSRFVMSNQQIRDLIDPNNQQAFTEDIQRINDLLETTQREYCLLQHKETVAKDFQLSKSLLGKLIYGAELDLAGNFLQRVVGRRLVDEDMHELVEFLMIDRTVVKLNLAYNSFTDDAIILLAGLLLIRTDIVHLNLAHNDLTPAGCFHFCEYLMQRCSLYSLKLCGMKIGEEGFNGLICLILCGRGPYDLDIGETDLTPGSFQGLCTAWQALDQDDDFPKYLVSRHPLPISLGVLADMKTVNSENKRKENRLEYRRSVVEFIQTGNGDGTPRTSRMEKLHYEHHIDHRIEHVHPQNKNREQMAKLSSSMEGLFEIPNLKSGPMHTLQNKSLKQLTYRVEEAQRDVEELPPMDLVIAEYHKIADVGCPETDTEGRLQIVCPSLYSLEVDDTLLADLDANGPLGTRNAFFIPTIIEEVIEEAAAVAAKDVNHARAPDDETANKAAVKLVQRAFPEAAQFASTTDYEDKSDVAQMLLAIVLETCQQLQELEDEKGDFNKEQLKFIWEWTTQKAVKVIQKLVPESKCLMNQEQITAFVQKFMETTSRTFLHLVRNPFIPPLLNELGTKACREFIHEESYHLTKSFFKNHPHPDDHDHHHKETKPPTLVHKLATDFLMGAVNEAAHLIGSGDPYYFRQSKTPESLKQSLEKSLAICDSVEQEIEGTLDNFFLAGAMLAHDASMMEKELEIAEAKAVEPSVEFLEQIFDKVAQLIIEMEDATRAAETETIPQKFPYAARPMRLVLNRPLFQDFEIILAGKMGEFLRTNSAIKCLHMRKWGLGEDGMAVLMDGLIFNTTIVLLDLSCNGLGSEGMKLLALYVKKNQSLKHLLLNHNGLRNPGLKYLSEGLPHSEITFLNIAYNDVADHGLDIFFECIKRTKIRALHVFGNFFSQKTWTLTKEVFDEGYLIPELCDFTLQDVGGEGMIVKNSQMRDTNEWYEVPPVVAEGLHRAPYFEEGAHLKVPNPSN